MVVSEKYFTVDEYIEFEENSEIRHEFHDGYLYPMSGTSDAHNEIVLNMATALRSTFQKQGCKIYAENLKLQIVENSKYLYPDIMLTCDERDSASPFIKRYASLIIEVLSKSTAAYDKSDKFDLYQRVASIQYYLLVDSRWQSVELYSRTTKGTIWTYQKFYERNEIIEFSKLNFELSLEDIYQLLNLPKRLSYLLGEIDESE
jgi:Uma2 family endonuclease